MRRGPTLALAIVAVCASACGAGPASEVDGWAIGQRLARCDTPQSLACSPYAGIAAAEVGGASNATVELFSEGVYSGGRLAVRGGGPVWIVVFTAPDGGRRAIGIGCGFHAQPPDCGVVTPPFDQSVALGAQLASAGVEVR